MSKTDSVGFECIGTLQTVGGSFDRCYDVDGFGRKLREAAEYGVEANSYAPGHEAKVFHSIAHSLVALTLSALVTIFRGLGDE